MNRFLAGIGAVALAAVASTGCGGDSSGPPATIAGAYAATEFVATGSFGQTNHLNYGSTLNIVLTSNGKTTGHLHMAAAPGNTEFDADMTGTWTQSGNTVTFSQNADSFVRDMPFTVVANGNMWALEGRRSFNGTEIRLTLTQVLTSQL